MSLQHCLVLTVATGAVWMDLRTRRIANEWIITAWIAGLVTQLIRYGARERVFFFLGCFSRYSHFTFCSIFICWAREISNSYPLLELSRCASDPEMYDCVVPVWSGLIYRNYSRLRKFTAASYQIFQLFPNLFYQKKISEKNRAGSLLRWEVGHGVHPFFRSRADGSAALDWGILLNTAKKKSVFAVCDTEMEYARNFMEYLNQKRNIPFEVHAFSSAEMFLEFAKNNETEILLISDKAMKEEIRRYPIRQIIILSEGVHSPVLDQYPAVYKYQSSEKVIREVMACYGVENGVDTSPALLPKKEMRIIGIYSPVGRTQKTSFALTMGQILAKERAVLYLNMESYSGFERLLECSYDRGMSDILYYARQENQGIIYKLGGMVQSMQNLDYLPPAASPMDIQTAKYEEWKWLFQEIEKNSSYEVLILDLGDGVADLYQILDFAMKFTFR